MIVFTNGNYRLDWQSVWVDTQAFRQVIARSRDSADPEPNVRQAVALYRGEFCQDAYYAWTEPVRHELERLYLNAVIRLADLLVERRALEEGHQILDTALALTPYSDALVQRAIPLDARRFGLRAAQERLTRFRKRLREDLDAEPEPATVAAFERMARDFSPDR